MNTKSFDTIISAVSTDTLNWFNQNTFSFKKKKITFTSIILNNEVYCVSRDYHYLLFALV